ncbi:hypothetical protein FDECE_8552 [Fusarium decemcellulare]|nr:hypothetical protein FDECE_8552 [Fusarium decemcellulare]
MASLLALIKTHRSAKPSFTEKPRQQQGSLASLTCQIDSPPTVILGDADESAGIKGRLLLHINDDLVEVESLCATLHLHVFQKKPLKKGCKDCKHQWTELKRCQFITPTATLQRNVYEFPFSYRVPNDLSPSMDTPIVSISYEFEATACVRRKGQVTRTPRIITFKRLLPVAHSLSVPSSPLCSSRIFEAAGIEVACRMGSIIDPNGTNNVSLTLNGLLSCPGSGETVQHWRLWKGSWRLEETVKTAMVGCNRHANEITSREEEKNRTRSKTTVLGEDGIYSGWTSNDEAGTVDMEFSFAMRRKSNKQLVQHTYDTGSSDDTEVTHSLVVELVLVKEHYPKGKPESAIRTGVGRILRSEHRVVLSEFARPSDDPTEECLPYYQELWPRPPMYEEEGLSMEETAI